MDYYIGAHILDGKTILDKLCNCTKIGGNALQIFLKSPIKSTDKIKLTKSDISQIYNYVKKNNIFLITHGSYMLNMCWPIHRNRWAIQLLIDDMEYTCKLGGHGVVIHIGKNTTKLNITHCEAIANFIESIQIVLDKTKGILIFETSCNEKNTIAGTITDLADIWNKFPKKYKCRIKFCIDTAHIFSAGYPIQTVSGFNNYIKKFNKYIGCNNIYLFHINDSYGAFNSGIDKHAGIGKGVLYKKNTNAFIAVILFCINNNIPMILETHDNYKKEIQFIKKIIKNSNQNGGNIKLKNKIICILEKVSEFEKNNGQLYKYIAYKRAIKNLKKFNGNIKTYNLMKIEGIGKKINNKILEIIKTGKLKQYNKFKNNPIQKYINILQNVMGIGPKSANELVTKFNIKNIEELKKAYDTNKIKLTHEQILGIKYNKHLPYPINRNEAEKIKEFIDIKLEKLNDNYTTILAGSFRRNKKQINDIDLIIYGKINKNSMNDIINAIQNIISDTILSGDVKFSGIIRLNKNYKFRRLDIRLVSKNNLPATLLYFTGSKEFNQKMRRLAKKKGYLLNEYGLYKIKNDQKIKIKVKTEKDIFIKLGMKYVNPYYRK